MTSAVSAQAIDRPSDKQPKNVLAGLKCPYCGAWTKHCDSSVVYGRSYGMIYLCEPCDAYVGTHKGGSNCGHALGRLANKELREWKKKAHAHFDALWKMSTKDKARPNAYKWLSDQMGIPPARTHIGMFNVDQCRQVVELCESLIASLRKSTC